MCIWNLQDESQISVVCGNNIRPVLGHQKWEQDWDRENAFIITTELLLPLNFKAGIEIGADVSSQ